MIFNTGHFSEERINIENKMHGLEVTELNTKIFEHDVMNKIDSVLRYETPPYVHWRQKSELRSEFQKELDIALLKDAKYKLLIKMCERKKAYIKE